MQYNRVRWSGPAQRVPRWQHPGGPRSVVPTFDDAVATAVQVFAIGQVSTARHDQQSGLLSPGAIQKVFGRQCINLASFNT